ncbi:iron-containing alcohol dehydrogenase [Erysipelotrichaceae bacterium RD49]|nr:iron-containing alcohol dehydrogenase [Erysipelotrichaceae bacterium RD49]
MKNNPIKTPAGQIEIGPDSLEKLPDLLRSCGSKVLLVHGHRPVEDGLLTKVRLLLIKENFPHANMGQILPNPKYDSVKRGIKIARKEKCDIILALGGGSTLQCAKGIALGLGYKGDVWDFWTGKKKPKKVYPIASILTNPSSGSELSTGCTLVRKGKQETVSNEGLKCTFTILDPNLAMYPFYPTMTQVFNLFIHLFNGALTLDGADYTECISLLDRLFAAASTMEQSIYNLDARTQLFQVGYESHAKLHISKCPVESLANDLAFKYSLTEGSAGCALFLSWVDSLKKEDKSKIVQIAKDLFKLDSCTFDQAMEAFKAKLQPTKLALSIPESGLLISDRDLVSITDNKDWRKILVHANRPVDAFAHKERLAHRHNTPRL